MTVVPVNFFMISDEFVMKGVDKIVLKHIKCIRKGATISINEDGIWCSLDRLEPITELKPLSKAELEEWNKLSLEEQDKLRQEHTKQMNEILEEKNEDES